MWAPKVRPAGQEDSGPGSGGYDTPHPDARMITLTMHTEGRKKAAPEAELAERPIRDLSVLMGQAQIRYAGADCVGEGMC